MKKQPQTNSLPNNYFFDTDEAMLDYLEAQANATIDEVMHSNLLHRQRAEKVINYLLIGIGSLALLAINNPNLLQTAATQTAFFTLCIGWGFAIFATSIYVLKGLRHSIKSNAPQNLYNKSFKQKDDPSRKLLRLRQLELIRKTNTINDLIAINKRFHRWNSIALFAAISAPALALIISSPLLR